MTDKVKVTNQKFVKLKELLMELFQLDQPELDFGFYRVMHARAKEVTQFLEKDLLPQVAEVFEQYQSADAAGLQEELEQAISQAKALGADPDTLPKVKELKGKLNTTAVDISRLESEVFDHLFTFFRRYYNEGDFLSKRVYKDGIYAIPYSGEEVKLHWANADQYYIKTDEYLKDYSFRLNPSDDNNPMRVHFRISAAQEGEHGNIKIADNAERRFILADGNFISEEDGEQGKELVLLFEYRPSQMSDSSEESKQGKKTAPTQKDLIQNALKLVFEVADSKYSKWIKQLMSSSPSTQNSSRTILEKHLDQYTKRNTFDYFIHKDLGAFLHRELDFYVKNEVMHLDDIENETVPKVEQYLSKIKAIRKIAGKLIEFLAQLENFQKKLWLKKKFVVETSYCISLDRIPEEFYPEIARNDQQRDEWVRLFGIDKQSSIPETPNRTSQQTALFSEPKKATYSVPLSTAFLTQNKQLLLDTRFFSEIFAARLLATGSGSDAAVTGTLVHSDNFQAVDFVKRKLREKVKCIYIDPPYNTSSSAIPYKNDYKHSSFATMIQDRSERLHNVLRRDGAIFVSIDKTERTVVEQVLSSVFGPDNLIEELIWSMNTNNSQAPNYSTNHEYVLVYAKDRVTAEQDRSMFREPKPGYVEVMELVSRINPEYPKLVEVEKALRDLYEEHKRAYRHEIELQHMEWENEKGNDPWKGLYNYSRAEYRNSAGKLVTEVEASELGARIWIWREGDMSMPSTKQAESTRDSGHVNWRFYQPPHPISGKPCTVPKRGWNAPYSAELGQRSFKSIDADNRVVWGSDHNKVPQIKRFLHEAESNVGKSVFVDYSDGEKETYSLFGKAGIFLAPKHSSFVSRFIQHAANKDSLILDCFGGSGSTAHAVINLNREDNGTRKYLLVEVGRHFDTVLKPRVLKATYARSWRDGSPISTVEGLSQCIKVLRLESYEDALNNLVFTSNASSQMLLPSASSKTKSAFNEKYLIGYLLDVETRDSPSLLSIKSFVDPTAYGMKVKLPGTDESKEVNVDLIETFNWLLGISVEHLGVPNTFLATFKRDSEGRLGVASQLKQSTDGKDAPWWFRTVSGKDPEGRRVLVIWRKRPGGDTAEGIEQDNLVLNEWFRKLGFSTKDSEFDVIYVNGSSNLENVRTPDERWKVRLIEEDFMRLMFDVEEI